MIDVSTGRQSLQHVHRGICEGNAVFTLGLHPVRWNSPDALVQVDLSPPRSKDFSGSRRSQDQELEREWGNSILLAKLADELRDFGVGQGGMMFDLADLRWFGQQVLKMTAPARRVVAGPIAACRRPVEDGFDPAPDSGGCLILRRP